MSNSLTTIKWDGVSLPTIVDTADVGVLPVGIDVFGLLVASAGFNDDTFSITTLDTDGLVLAVDTQAVPAGCTDPGHALFLESSNNAVIVSCNGSDSFAYIPNAY